LGTRRGARFVELPWFGFSAFYAGLQLADFIAYLIDIAANEELRSERTVELRDAFAMIQGKVQLVRIP
jgi:hypothetical protein